jgi:hypothetical protein
MEVLEIQLLIAIRIAGSEIHNKIPSDLKITTGSEIIVQRIALTAQQTATLVGLETTVQRTQTQIRQTAITITVDSETIRVHKITTKIILSKIPIQMVAEDLDKTILNNKTSSKHCSFFILI